LNDRITTVQYLERIPDGNIAGRRKLIEELKQKEEAERQAAQAQAQQQAMMQQMQAAPPAPEPPAGSPGEMAAQNDMGEAGGAATREVAENGAREEQRSTGFKELRKALKRIA
ncbi:MAG: hypothetical protein II581_07090, partial [Oscillospiraceae bacterium]|nr:hypothetical protein [Oscillospiraceae bacterium]